MSCHQVVIPAEEGGVWLDNFGCPYEFCANKVQVFKDAMKLKEAGDFKNLPSPACFGLLLKVSDRSSPS